MMVPDIRQPPRQRSFSSFCLDTKGPNLAIAISRRPLKSKQGLSKGQAIDKARPGFLKPIRAGPPLFSQTDSGRPAPVFSNRFGQARPDGSRGSGSGRPAPNGDRFGQARPEWSSVRAGPPRTEFGSGRRFWQLPGCS